MEHVPYFQLGMGVIDFMVVYAWFMGLFDNVFIVYLGGIMALMTALVSAGYVSVKVIDASVSFAEGFAFNYRNYSNAGNSVGRWNLIFTVMMLAWSLITTLLAFTIINRVVTETQLREVAVAEDGTFGEAVDYLTALKFFALFIVLATSTWISGHTIADNADDLLDWLNHYDDDTDSEATDK